MTEEQPSLLLSYYEVSVPVPGGWDARASAYLLSGPPYDELASEARGRGWIVEQLPGGICTSWLTLMVSPGRCWRSPTRWGSPRPNW